MHIIYNPFAGISGDMNLAAMIDLGMNTDLLKQELSKLGLDHEFEIKVYPAEKHGINGTQVKVVLKNEHTPHHHEHKHEHKHTHEGKHAHHEHSHTSHHHTHSHDRDYAKIKDIINNSDLDKQIKKLSIEIFWEVAIAEGKVHNKAPEEVHFHEVGATDSIVDIVGAAICHHHLNITHVTTSYPELGGGFVTCQHGKMPVPAPATAEILKDIPSTTGAVPKEMTTPTGAAILKVLSDEIIEHPDLNIIKTAYGIGHRDVEIPNVLRVYHAKQDKKMSTSKAIMAECNIDDMTAEDLAIIPQLLLDAGAQDAYLSPIIMKKGRAAHKLSVLCREDLLTIVENLIFEHTSTLGLRYYEVNKIELSREIKKMDSPWGEVSYKETSLPNGTLRRKFEFDEIEQIASDNKLSTTAIRKELESKLK